VELSYFWQIAERDRGASWSDPRAGSEAAWDGRGADASAQSSHDTGAGHSDQGTQSGNRLQGLSRNEEEDGDWPKVLPYDYRAADCLLDELARRETVDEDGQTYCIVAMRAQNNC